MFSTFWKQVNQTINETVSEIQESIGSLQSSSEKSTPNDPNQNYEELATKLLQQVFPQSLSENIKPWHIELIQSTDFIDTLKYLRLNHNVETTTTTTKEDESSSAHTIDMPNRPKKQKTDHPLTEEQYQFIEQFAIVANEHLNTIRREMVPSKWNDLLFWHEYFYRVESILAMSDKLPTLKLIHEWTQAALICEQAAQKVEHELENVNSTNESTESSLNTEKSTDNTQDTQSSLTAAQIKEELLQIKDNAIRLESLLNSQDKSSCEPLADQLMQDKRRVGEWISEMHNIGEETLVMNCESVNRTLETVLSQYMKQNEHVETNGGNDEDEEEIDDEIAQWRKSLENEVSGQ